MSEEDPNKDLLPTIDELRVLVAESISDKAVELQRIYERQFHEVSTESQEKYTHLKGLRDHYIHKGRWSNFLMCVMAFMIIFQSILLWQVGLGNLDFAKYDWLLPALLVQNLAQVIGLAVFVVKALFRDLK